MARHRVYRTEAVVIRRSDFGEADRLLTLITPQGKRRVIAKGTRKTTSRLAGHIELFTHTTMLLAIGRTLDIVTQSVVVSQFHELRHDLQRISAAYYVAELIDHLVGDEDENRPAFDLLLATLSALDITRNIDLILRYYELHLLSYAGYRPQFHYCAACQEVLYEDANRFSPSNGGMLCPRCGTHDATAMAVSLNAFKLLRFLQAQSLEAIEELTLTQAVCEEVRQILHVYVRQILERNLKSIAFLQEVRQTIP
ncbi:MAG: DNA repair protein RecO [Chloroflexi bacterium AL-W]|nr:DNA repair protein RecO [Chloroflexi bacterium AL-N1]NOK68796.1 DNA repair protein RecO [Chloroflexi bacterium AL-N10]NOK76282.1 DNA repair protein RecO [Chloroflexi bacterium AL-N5]NOK84081.1 DNA repair protein RecO [Chloroflexi bacterium AL-W]NOK91420.1 DNA repair protein RecO [Chloroflexi bacterium AL-N15]